ncbi:MULTISPECIES: type II toxin-antitoxin system VapB family antitoxin [Moraxella]|uniref:Antitoxin n=1 Tax=Moraxella lacunata TaxID=477 RepID=A0A1B8PWZ2_MORLA|nr:MULTISPECIES: type II toxin-antitoxin system VapB family antitoxin [Moraxella]MBE9578919.1 antitoxin [Moraxella sp. K1664]MBE9588263.1 antitoxin [Moraxella sp. K1630]MBE9590848.1 antitoxin [Moraxella sp. K127]MBE9596363.1 antitoxin [Moraxella sp. K2450]MDH9218770.1 type II toxin-antitoxin system VapB family antitoxin [Moraxella lacunata]
MTVASIFKTNQTQAVRLPKVVAFPDNIKHVDVKVVGNTRILSPAGSAWDYFFDHVDVPDDFMSEREQPMPQEREELFP